VAVEEARFEVWDPAGRHFGLVTSGQAWHWVDPHAGAIKAAQVLPAGGRVGLFWNHGRHRPEMRAALAVVYRRHAPGLGDSLVLGNPITSRLDVAADGLRSCGSFEPPAVVSFGWAATYRGEEWVDQLPTHSDHRSLPEERRRALLAAVAEAIADLGGTVEMEYRTWLVTSRRRAE
jgi:hypothetical protein